MAEVRGIHEYTTTNGMPVMFLHYSADVAKDPTTPEGALWKMKELNSYPGGEQGPGWLQEMEIRFDVRDTARVWPNFDEMCQYVVVPDFDIRQYEHWPLYVGYDYGPQEPHAFLVIAFAGRDECYLIDEIYKRETSIAELAMLIKQKPYYNRIRTIYADPSIWARTQQDGFRMTSIGTMFEDQYDITMQKGQNYPGSDAAFIHMLNSVLWQKDKVKFRIFASCTNTLKELRLLSWSDKVTDLTKSNSTVLETISSKLVHAFDALKYVMLERWQGVSISSLGAPPGSIDWEIAQAERARNTFKYVLTADARP